MKQAIITLEEARAVGVTHPVTSRSYATWAKHLRALLASKGIPDECLDKGRIGVHIQCEGDKYLFVFHEGADTPTRNAAERTAAAAVIEQQSKALTRNAPKKSRASA